MVDGNGKVLVRRIRVRIAWLHGFVRGLLTRPSADLISHGIEREAEYIRVETRDGKTTLVGFPEVMWMGVNEFADLYQDSVLDADRAEANEWAAVQIEKRRLAYIEAQGAVL